VCSRRHHVHHQRQRMLGAGCGERQADLHYQQRERKGWSAMRAAESIAAQWSPATASFMVTGPCASHRSKPPHGKTAMGITEMPTGVRTTVPTRRHWRWEISLSPAPPAAISEFAASWWRLDQIHRQRSVAVLGPRPHGGSPVPRPGRARISTTAVQLLVHRLLRSGLEHRFLANRESGQ